MTVTDYERWIEMTDREAVGDDLSESERAFLVTFGETDSRAREERNVWQAFASLAPLTDDLGNRALADAAVRRVHDAERASRRRSPPWLAWAGGGALAAAAAAALFVSRRGAVEQQATGDSVVEYVAVGARTIGNAVNVGAHLAAGTEIEAVGGPVCVIIVPDIHVCLADGAKLRLSQVAVPEGRHVDLLGGRVAVALHPLPIGQRFSIVANRFWSTAVGTAFTVELEPSGAVETIVHEGKVAVGPEGSADVVSAHKIGLSAGGAVSIAPLASHDRTETPEWAALASVAQRSIETLPLPASAATPSATEAPAVVPPEPAATTAPGSPGQPSPSRKPQAGPAAHQVDEQPAIAAPTASELLSSARQALREQRWDDASSAYRQIATAFPASPEAHTVLVPLARLEIERLGQPAAALRDLDAYLTTGGPLDVEAELSRISAYRALGRASDEARAIDDFLLAHPNNLDAAALRQRRATLGTQ